MKIHASMLAANIFDQANWISKLSSKVDAFHIDIIDPSVANYVGLDYRIIPKMHELGYEFYIHYMAKWNDELIIQMAEQKPAGIFFHQKHIQNRSLFEELKKSINVGIALEIGDFMEIDVQQYILMNVQLGYCGQKFDNRNIKLSHQLKAQGKTIISDGGITLDNITELKHFDALVIGNTLNKASVEEINERLMRK